MRLQIIFNKFLLRCLNIFDLFCQVLKNMLEYLLTVGGKNLLKDEMIQDINNVINSVTESKKEVQKNNVKAVLFTTFVIK
mgnify:CR=1 FL=1